MCSFKLQNPKISLKEAVKFHGHLGPYLVLGILSGELALKRLKCSKHFGLEVRVYGTNKKPKSCLIDGLQISTGATYGKGNIQKIKDDKIKVLFYNLKNKKKIGISLREDLLEELNNLKTHRESEIFAKKLYKSNPLNIFNLNPKP